MPRFLFSDSLACNGYSAPLPVCLTAHDSLGQTIRGSGTGSHSPCLPSMGQSGRGYSAYPVTSGNPPCPVSVSSDRHSGRDTHLPAFHICDSGELDRGRKTSSARTESGRRFKKFEKIEISQWNQRVSLMQAHNARGSWRASWCEHQAHSGKDKYIKAVFVFKRDVQAHINEVARACIQGNR